MQKQPTKQATAKVGNYGLVSKFPGYHAREDQTTVGASMLIAPSQNVMLNTSGRVALIKGYTLDGATSAVIDSGILSHFDFINFKGDVRNLRAGFLTSAANDGKLQYRYLDASKAVNWVDLATSLTTVHLSFTEYWDNTALVKNVLWVNGSNNVFLWNGAVTTFASATATTITKQGTTTWAQEGFSTSGTRSVVIGGVTATYTGGESTTTLTGVSVDFSASAVGSIVHQAPVTTALSTMTSISATFAPTVIGCGRRNQVYLGSSNNNLLMISQVNSYTNYTFTTPTRIVGEGAQIPLDNPPVKFVPQEASSSDSSFAYDMFISEGLNAWSIIRATLSSDLTKETLEHIRLKNSPLQAAKSERLCAKMKNMIMFIGNDSVANFLGQVSGQDVPAIIDFSYSIVDDMKSYDFTDGSIYYNQNYIYVMIPKSGIIRVYNMTDQTQEYSSYNRTLEDVTQQPWFWEAPVTYPISGMYWTPDKGLCGHSYTTSESYQLFTGGSLNGQQIDANATFGFDDKGDRTQTKVSNELWIEGYIKQNTTLNATVTGDLNTFASSQTVTVKGNDSAIVAYGAGAHSLGTTSLGSQPLGGALLTASTLPAWFHVAKTYPPAPAYLEQLSFFSKGVDLQWELITFGTNAEFTNESNNDITQ